MSLWSVDDCSTSDLMVRFYKRLKMGATKDQALRTAKLTHLSSADKVNTHPYYWAAFVQSGNSEEMFSTNGAFNYWWLLLATAPILLVFFRKK